MAKNVTVYSTPTCVYCTLVKQYLKDNGVQFKEIDVSVDQKAAEEMIEKSGQMGVPVIDVDGRIIVGFDRPALQSALGLK
ncbi:glutathione S-transferase N-terminal domain-containing protein [Candidatus Micrarchaeota archaeon]|nr:glutathione S-transferase N-terminal domain-containing protein [Candidatus Micrarchaeota archaeon]